MSVAALSIGLVSVGGAANATTSEPTIVEEQSCSFDLGTRSLVCVAVGDDLNQAVLEQQNLVVVTPTGALGTTATAAATDTATTETAAVAVPVGALATSIQAQLYSDANYGGAYFQITNSAACNGSTTWYFGPLSNVGWSSKVSSFKSFSNCSTKVWQGSNYSGAAYGYAVNASSLGAMNDLANSVTMK
ncbi:hypothetical protein GCM10022381_26550 [Leifsonia kafniensis]|uniref:Uncharacterized protein n=1 Tax=Leifsonia kafniensis TaxID=475957 RepID=A0ABP7KR65_9MICO